MGRRRDSERQEGIVFGLILVALGAVFLLDRLDDVEAHDLWHWWPLLLTAHGLSKILGWRSADRVGSGVTEVLFSGWFLVSNEGWWGFSWVNSWPLVFVAIGLGMVVRSALGPAFDRRSEAEVVSDGGGGGAS